MAVSKLNIYTGGPDLVTGAIRIGPLGTALPADARAVPNVALLDAGYAGEDGLSISSNISTTEIRDWSGAVVYTAKDQEDDTLKFTFLEVNAVTLGAAFGSDNVTATAGAPTHGAQLRTKFNVSENDHHVMVFSMISGGKLQRASCPDAQIVERGELTFSKKGATMLAVTVKLLPDASGNTIYWDIDNDVLVP